MSRYVLLGWVVPPPELGGGVGFKREIASVEAGDEARAREYFHKHYAEINPQEVIPLDFLTPARAYALGHDEGFDEGLCK